MNIYSHPQLYDAIHHNYKLDIALVQSIAKNISGSVLELASGTGRLAEPIIKLGLNYTGLELSEPAVKLAKKNTGIILSLCRVICKILNSANTLILYLSVLIHFYTILH